MKIRNWIITAGWGLLSILTGATVAHAQTITLDGEITRSDSAYFKEGDPVEISWKLSQPVSPIYLGWGTYGYASDASPVKIGGVEQTSFNLLPYDGRYSEATFFGMNSGYQNFWTSSLYILDISFFSWGNRVTDPMGILIPELPLADFDYHTGILKARDDGAFSATFDITSYSVTGYAPPVGAVPEPSTYGLVGAGVLGLALVLRRRKTK